MRIEFDDGTLLLRDAPENVPHAEWDDRVDEYRTRAYRYRSLLEWAGKWTDGNEQATLHEIEEKAHDFSPVSYPQVH